MKLICSLCHFIALGCGHNLVMIKILNRTKRRQSELLQTLTCSSLPLAEHNRVHCIASELLFRVDVKALHILWVHLTTPVPGGKLI